MELSKFQEFFLYKMVHPDVAASWLNGSGLPRLFINEVPDTSFIAQGISEGVYEDEPINSIIEGVKIITGGNIGVPNFDSGLDPTTNLTAEMVGMAKMPVYMKSEGPEGISYYKSQFMFVVKTPEDIKNIKKMTIDGEDYIWAEDIDSGPQDFSNMAVVYRMSEFEPISNVNAAMERMLAMKEYEQALLENPDDPELQAEGELLKIQFSLFEAITNLGPEYQYMCHGTIYIISTDGFSGNVPFEIHTECENDGEIIKDVLKGTFYEYVEPVYIEVSSPDWRSGKYQIKCKHGGCEMQYSTYDQSGNIIDDWTSGKEGYSTDYIIIDNPEKSIIKFRGVDKNGNIIVDPVTKEIPWPHIDFVVDTNVNTPGDIHVSIENLTNTYYTMPVDSIPENSEDTPTTHYTISYSFDGNSWVPVEIALPEWKPSYWETKDTCIDIPDSWGKTKLMLKAEYSDETGLHYEHIYQQNLEVFVPEPRYDGLTPISDGTLKINISHWQITGGKTWYKIDNGEWTEYDPENKPTISNSGSYVLKIQNRTSDGLHESVVVEENIQVTQNTDPLYMTFTAGENGANISVSRRNNSVCQASEDHETWTSISNPLELDSNETIYIRNFGDLPMFNTVNGSVTVTGCLDALVSPYWKGVVVSYTGRNFEGNMDCSGITLFSYDFGNNYNIYNLMFSGNTGTKSFSNFDNIQSNPNAYNSMFNESSIETVSNLQSGYSYSYTFAYSNLSSIPILPDLKINLNGRYNYIQAFDQCDINIVDENGNWSFGENNFDFSQGPILGCSEPSDLGQHLGIVDPDWKVYVRYYNEFGNISIGDPVNTGGNNNYTIIYKDEIPENGVSFAHNTNGGKWMLNYKDSDYDNSTIVSEDPYYFKPDNEHARYYLRVAKTCTINSISVKTNNNEEVSEDVFSINDIQLKYIHGGENSSSQQVTNLPCDVLYSDRNARVYINSTISSGHTVSCLYSSDNGTTWNNSSYLSSNTHVIMFNGINALDIKFVID